MQKKKIIILSGYGVCFVYLKQEIKKNFEQETPLALSNAVIATIVIN